MDRASRSVQQAADDATIGRRRSSEAQACTRPDRGGGRLQVAAKSAFKLPATAGAGTASTAARPEGPSKEAPRALPGDQGRELIGATEFGIAIAGAEAETAAFDRRKQVARCLGSQQVGTG